MKNDIVERVRKGGLPDPGIKWPTMHFESGGAAPGDSGDGGTGAASSATGDAPGPGASGTGNGTGLGDGSSPGNSDTGEDGLGTPSTSPSFSTSATAPAATALAETQANLGVTPTEAAMMSQSNPTGSNVATNGMTASELGMLSANGFGSMSISDTQTVDQAIASLGVASMTPADIAAVLGMVNPGLGQAVAMAQGLHGLVSGQVGIGQTAVNAAIGAVASSLGIPAGVVAGVVNGNPGQAASSATASAVAQGLAQALGLPSNVVSSVMGMSGATAALGQAVSGSVNAGLGTAPTGQSNTSAIASGINGAIGGLGVGPAGSSSPSGGATAGISGGGCGPSDFGGGSGLSQLPATSNQSAALPVSSPTSSGLNSLVGTSPSSLDASSPFLDSRPELLVAKQLGGLRALTDAAKLEELKQIAEAPKQGLPEPQTAIFAEGGTTKCTLSDFEKAINPQFAADTSLDFLTSSAGRQRQPLHKQLVQMQQNISHMGNMGGLAHGGLPKKYQDAAPEGHNPEFVTGLTGFYACGRGTGQSDCIPAMLHDGDYVMDAEAVSALGDGSSKAGREVLEKFHKQVPHQASTGGKVVPAKIADGEYVFPAGFVTALGGGDNKRGAEILDGLREKLRNHKRSAPTSKIPPKAKSPLDYLKMAKG